MKVFQTQVGFYDIVIAVPSQAAALRAWGTRQNLFADGQAKLTTDEAAVKMALAHPDTPLRRAVGSNDAFALEPTSLPKVPDAPKRVGKSKAAAKPRAAPKPPADRTQLDAAEARLKALDEKRKREESTLRKKQAVLDEEIATAQSDYVAKRIAATAAIVDARKAYRQAGGAD